MLMQIYSVTAVLTDKLLTKLMVIAEIFEIQ